MSKCPHCNQDLSPGQELLNHIKNRIIVFEKWISGADHSINHDNILASLVAQRDFVKKALERDRPGTIYTIKDHSLGMNHCE